MKIEKNICDRCKEELGINASYIVIKGKKTEFCETCAEEFKEFMMTIDDEFKEFMMTIDDERGFI